MKANKYIPAKIDALSFGDNHVGATYYRSTVVHPYSGRSCGFIIRRGDDGKWNILSAPWAFGYIKRFLSKRGECFEDLWMLQEFINNEAMAEA